MLQQRNAAELASRASEHPPISTRPEPEVTLVREPHRLSRPGLFKSVVLATCRAAGFVSRAIDDYASEVRKRTSASVSAAGKPAMKEKKKNGITVQEYRRWMSSRDAHLAASNLDLTAEPSNKHVDVAILQEWVDGDLTDQQVERYMHKFDDCQRCRAVYEEYKTEKSQVVSDSE